MASTSAPPWLHGTGRGAKDGRSPIRGQDRTAVPAPSSATHHHTPRHRRCGPARAGDDSSAPPHKTPTVSARPPGTGQLSGTGHLSHRAHPSGAPTTTTAVHGRARRARQARQGRAGHDRPTTRGTHPVRHPPARRVPGNFTIRFPTQESRATVTPLNFAIALVFGRDGARDRTRGQHFPERTISNRPEPPTWCREPA